MYDEIKAAVKEAVEKALKSEFWSAVLWADIYQDYM